MATPRVARDIREDTVLVNTPRARVTAMTFTILGQTITTIPSLERGTREDTVATPRVARDTREETI